MTLKRSDIKQQIAVVVPKTFDIEALNNFDINKLEYFYDKYVQNYKRPNGLDAMYPVGSFYKHLSVMLVIVFAFLMSTFKHFYPTIAKTPMNQIWLDFFKMYYENQIELSFIFASAVSLVYVSMLKLKHESSFNNEEESYDVHNLALANKYLEELENTTLVKYKKGDKKPVRTLTQLRDNVKFLQDMFDDDDDDEAKSPSNKDTKSKKASTDRNIGDNPIRVKLTLKNNNNDDSY